MVESLKKISIMGDEKWWLAGGKINRIVGEGTGVKFWENCWGGGRKLKLSFSTLYQITKDEEHSIRDMGEWRLGG